VSNKVDLRAAKIKQLEKFFEENFRREEDFWLSGRFYTSATHTLNIETSLTPK
jgi:hypothetical protein